MKQWFERHAQTLVGSLGEAERALADLVGPQQAEQAARALARFEDVRRAEQLDESAAEMLQRLYV